MAKLRSAQPYMDLRTNSLWSNMWKRKVYPYMSRSRSITHLDVILCPIEYTWRYAISEWHHIYVQCSFWICTALIVKVIHLRLRRIFFNLLMRYDTLSICNCTHLTLKMGAKIFSRMSVAEPMDTWCKNPKIRSTPTILMWMLMSSFVFSRQYPKKCV